MKKAIYRSDERGFSNHGWLKSFHTFNFANYYEESRMGFGTLRVFNEDIVEPGSGFGSHPHDNIEIISIPMSGTMAHKDSYGNEYNCRKGDIQVISAGTGITHSDYNPSGDDILHFLQVWILPDLLNTEPSYQHRRFRFEQNNLRALIRPDGRYGCLSVQQDAYFSMGHFSKDKFFRYELTNQENGLFICLINGKMNIYEEVLHASDSIGLEGLDAAEMCFTEDSEVLIIEVSMERQDTS